MKKVTREEFFVKLAKFRLDNLSKREIGDFIEDFDCCQNDEASGLLCALQEKYAGVTNGFLSDIFEMLFGEVVEIEGAVRDLFKCPCCERKTLDEAYDPVLGTGYDICPICKWEDDGTLDIKKSSGVNKGSIFEYREKMQGNMNFYYRSKYR